MIAEPGCVTWEAVPEPPPGSLTDPDTGEPGTRLEFRAPDGHLIAAEHRTATMFTWWEGLPDGIGWGGQGRILLRARFRADRDGAHLIGAGGVGQLALFVNGTGLAEGITPDPADPVEAMVRPGEIRATVTLRAGPGGRDRGGPAAVGRGTRAGVHPAGRGPRARRGRAAGGGRAGRARRGRGHRHRGVGAGRGERGVRPARAGADRPPGRAGTPDRGGQRPDGRGRQRGHAGADAVGGRGRRGGVRLAGRPGAWAMPWPTCCSARWSRAGGCRSRCRPPRPTARCCTRSRGTASCGTPRGCSSGTAASTGPERPRASRSATASATPAGRWNRPGRPGMPPGRAGRSAREDAGGRIRIGPGEDVELAVVVLQYRDAARPGGRPGLRGAPVKGRDGPEPRTGRDRDGPEPQRAGRPVRTLAAFGAAAAAPGETAEVRLRIPARAFARYDEQAGAGPGRAVSSPCRSAARRGIFRCRFR